MDANSLVWPARAYAACVALRQRDFDAAAPVFVELMRDGRVCSAAAGFALTSSHFIDALVPRACEELLIGGRRDLAERVFAALRADLAGRDPATDLTQPAALRELLVAPRAAGVAPADPAFVLFFAGVLDATAPAGAAGERLRALQALAAEFPRQEPYGERLGHYANLAGGFLPRTPAPPAPKPRFVYDSSFTLGANPPGKPR
jgi:hypothetical protein